MRLKRRCRVYREGKEWIFSYRPLNGKWETHRGFATIEAAAIALSKLMREHREGTPWVLDVVKD